MSRREDIKMFKILIFGGTTEGRILIDTLARDGAEKNLTVFVSVATDYGKELIAEAEGKINILSGRLSEQDMASLMKEQKFDCVIDATHPYATVVSENIQSACGKSHCEYIRVVRERAKNGEHCIVFNSHEEVVDYLNQREGKALLTIGSKELKKYLGVRSFEDRIFPRVLPMPDVVKSCYEMGFTGKQLICMQGPFSMEMNLALMAQVGAQYMVTKDSGDYGGFMDKYRAAEKMGVPLLVIGRSTHEEGYSLSGTIAYLRKKTGILFKSIDIPKPRENPGQDLGQWFPFFINISDKKVVVIGGGKIALRRILTLMNFRCRVKVVSIDALPEVAELADRGRLELEKKAFEDTDVEGAHYVLAATNSHEVNMQIYEACKSRSISVNVASDKEKSDFYFPGIIRKNGITAGVTADGKNHKLAKSATAAIRECLDLRFKEDGEDE